MFVREVETQSQFYTMSGRWIHRSSQSATFFVPRFVEPEELDDILPHLPTTEVSFALRDTLQNMPLSVPRELGKPLIRKMLDFWTQSDVAYQAASVILDGAHEHVAHPIWYRYATIEHIAETILPASTPRTEDGRFPDPVLYALHRSLLRDDLGFRPLMKGALRAGGLYEISSIGEARHVKRTRRRVRSARVIPNSLQDFAVLARRAIDHSRRTRPFTAHGTIGSSGLQNPDDTTTRELYDAFTTGVNKTYLLFMESWAALASFGHRSSLHGIGSEILRATQRYEEVDLGPTTAWTFLQEIDFIPPWENPLIFGLRLPGVGHRLRHSQVPHLRYLDDSLKDQRKAWGELPVYCIDDPGAHEIDDGISIETTGAADEYWVHIHAADPTSHLSTDCLPAAYDLLATENVYVPGGRVYNMLDVEAVRDNFSLASDRPCMTFSARVNKEGQLLEAKIMPGNVHNVLFLSPTVLNEVVSGSSPYEAEQCVRTVGKHLPESGPSRPMLESHELSDAHKADLRLLHTIGDAHAAILRANGGIDQNFPSKPKLSVSIPSTSNSNPMIQIATLDGHAMPKSEPPIQSNLVQSCMLIASQVAARWCSERGIPVPYRVTERNTGKEEPSEFFARKVLPSRAENGVATAEITSEYLRLIGSVSPSLNPKPHVAVGADMMLRCTSPLRRFTDLLVHWQIGAALLEEARLGHSLVGNTKDDFLPFSRDRVETFLPLLDWREKFIKYSKKEIDRHWLCLFLLRAWKFKESELPSIFPFLVRNINPKDRTARGMLTDYMARAQCSIPEDMNLEDIKVGETINVELENINVYERKIQVKAV